MAKIRLEDLAFELAVRSPSCPPFPDLNAPCRVCGRPNDHYHYEWNPLTQRNEVKTDV